MGQAYNLQSCDAKFIFKFHRIIWSHDLIFTDYRVFLYSVHSKLIAWFSALIYDYKVIHARAAIGARAFVWNERFVKYSDINTSPCFQNQHCLKIFKTPLIMLQLIIPIHHYWWVCVYVCACICVWEIDTHPHHTFPLASLRHRCSCICFANLCKWHH